jgi:protoporphyrinogen oxidase
VAQIHAAEGRVTGLRLADGGTHDCDRVVSTVPLAVLAGLLPGGWEDYAAQLRQVRYIGVACLSLKLERRVSPYFWLNVHDTRAPFNGIIEYTNLNPLRPEDGHIVYVPYYVPTDHPIYRLDDDTLFERSWEALKLITPGLTDADLIAHHVARAPFAQAITPTNFLQMLPEQHAPIRGLRLLDSVFLYPEDRTQSGHIQKARECAAGITEP